MQSKIVNNMVKSVNSLPEEPAVQMRLGVST